MEELLQSTFTGWGEGRRWRSYCSPSLLGGVRAGDGGATAVRLYWVG